MRKQLSFYVSWASILSAIATVLGLFLMSPDTETKIDAVTAGNNSPVIVGSHNTVVYPNAINSDYLNSRKPEYTDLSPSQIASAYFDLYNQKQFRLACSLFKKAKCDPEDGSKMHQFTRESEKQLSGYESVRIWTPKEDNPSEIVCTRFKYRYKADLNPAYIYEVSAFYIDKREDGQYEITSRGCEKLFKDSRGELVCPQPVSVKYCI